MRLWDRSQVLVKSGCWTVYCAVCSAPASSDKLVQDVYGRWVHPEHVDAPSIFDQYRFYVDKEPPYIDPSKIQPEPTYISSAGNTEVEDL